MRRGLQQSNFIDKMQEVNSCFAASSIVANVLIISKINRTTKKYRAVSYTDLVVASFARVQHACVRYRTYQTWNKGHTWLSTTFLKNLFFLIVQPVITM